MDTRNHQALIAATGHPLPPLFVCGSGCRLCSHELRHPLAPLRTGIELLGKVREQPQLLETIPPMMERQIHQLVSLIDRLLDVFQEPPPAAGVRTNENDGEC